MERLEDDRVGRLDVHAEARQDHDDEQVDAGHHAELGQRIVPDVLAWGPVEKQVPAEVRQQIQPPAFPPERNDEDLSGVLVAEEREDDAPKQADGDDEPRNEVGHAGIAHIKEIGRIAVWECHGLPMMYPRGDKHEKREHHAPVPDADRQLEDIDGFPFLNRFVHGVLLSPYGPSAVRCRPAPRRASHRQGRDRSCGAYARFPAAAWAHPSSCRAGRPHTGRAGRRRCAVRRSMWSGRHAVRRPPFCF